VETQTVFYTLSDYDRSLLGARSSPFASHGELLTAVVLEAAPLSGVPADAPADPGHDRDHDHWTGGRLRSWATGRPAAPPRDALGLRLPTFQSSSIVACGGSGSSPVCVYSFPVGSP
jgi:hypothetical protein